MGIFNRSNGLNKSHATQTGISTKQEKIANRHLVLTVHQILNRITKNLSFRRKCLNNNVTYRSVTKTAILQHRLSLEMKEDQLEMDKMKLILLESVRKLTDRVDYITSEVAKFKR